MKYFKVLKRYADGKITKGEVDVIIIEAESIEDAKNKYGYDGVIAIREVSITELLGGDKVYYYD